MRRLMGVAMLAGLGMSAAMVPAVAGAYPPVPPPIVEVVPAAPGPAYAWRPGGWHWNGYRYVWFRGGYVVPAAGLHRWVPPHWGPRGFWVPGHWA